LGATGVGEGSADAQEVPRIEIGHVETLGTPVRRGESEGRGLAGCVVAARLLREPIEPTGLDVCLQLKVPSNPVELQKPGTELSKLLWRERLDLPLDVLDLAHVRSRLNRVQHSFRGVEHS